MYILYEPLFSVLKPFDGTRLYNIRFVPVLPYTALQGFTGHSGNYWTIAAQAGKQTDRIFSDFSAFPANMGEYPFLTSKRLYGQIIALYGKLCRFCILSDCAGNMFPCPVSTDVYVNLPTCPLEYYVNRSDSQENFMAWSICHGQSGYGRKSGRQKSAL